ncbi:MAG: hypothetical protein OJF49_002180 [Ktedonobacterales bacterium]|jgi:uncharacterized protein YndB with AHSA1/START domain|nr:MAG: hypothetical protein OJF49_002180 [Ktedonobacterales bacterium]
MTRIYTSATIERGIEDVFAYVTAPGHWPEWHPSSLDVSGATDHALDVGEQCTEHFRVAGREGYVVWTVTERDAPRRWVIAGTIVGGGSGVITYALTAHDSGMTSFERTFEYPTPNPLLALLDTLVLRRRITAESQEALRRLKARLEASGTIS